VRADGFNASDTSALLCNKLSTACRGPQVRTHWGSSTSRCVLVCVCVLTRCMSMCACAGQRRLRRAPKTAEEVAAEAAAAALAPAPAADAVPAADAAPRGGDEL
jgi:hypothetical protein